MSFRPQLWNQGNEESSLNVLEPGSGTDQVKQYGLLSLLASQSAHTASDSLTSSFTLPTPALIDLQLKFHILLFPEGLRESGAADSPSIRGSPSCLAEQLFVLNVPHHTHTHMCVWLHTQNTLLNFLTGNLIIFRVPIAFFPPVRLASA